ncbi:MAG: hypothetical protein WB444_05535 [Gallionella sp.]
MAIEVNPTDEEMSELHDELKAYEIQLATYLSSSDAANDPNYAVLTKADIQLNLLIYNLSVQQLEIAGDNAGAAVDAINGAISNLKVVIATKNNIAKNLGIAQSAVSFVTALLSGNASTIVSAGSDFINKVKTA